jgi:hypothetical protein
MSKKQSLIFIDTNIFLDFYRATGTSDFKLLNRQKKIQDSIITSSQVEMEFHKNREKRLKESFAKLESISAPEIPAILLKTDEFEEFNSALKEAKRCLTELRNNLSRAMRKPIDHDPVYLVAKDIFSLDSEFNLSPTNPKQSSIRPLARERFALGYPPRKDKDTSNGDALNWEWIVDCAKESQRSVIIVSRDGDYGLTFDKESYLNDWLRHEFSERVGGNCRVADSITRQSSKRLRNCRN